MASPTADHFTTILLGLVAIVPWVPLIGSIASGKFLWLTVLDLIGMHVGPLVMLRGYRDDNHDLKKWGAGTHAMTLLPCFAVLAILQ